MAASQNTERFSSWSHFAKGLHEGVPNFEGVVICLRETGEEIGRSGNADTFFSGELSELCRIMTNPLRSQSCKINGQTHFILKDDAEDTVAHEMANWCPALHQQFAPQQKADVLTTLLLFGRGLIPVSKDVLMNLILPEIAGAIAVASHNFVKRQILFKKGSSTVFGLRTKLLVIFLRRNPEGGYNDGRDRADLPNAHKWMDYLINLGY